MSFIYPRKVQFYETDAMQIVHHANYIRWFEEARTQWLEDAGYSYAQMEADGIAIPVLSVHCDYKHSLAFGDTALISVKLVKYDSIRMELHYDLHNQATGTLSTLGDSSHCFINKATGRPTALKRSHPKMDKFFVEGMTQ